MNTRAVPLPRSAPMQEVGPYLRLCKTRIAALSTLSAAAAACLAGPRPTAAILPPLAGLFLIACGSGALNQVQERALDARMQRTRGRPLPAGQIRPRAALLFAACLMPPGFLLLLRGGGPVAAFLGLAAVIWYNGVYTGLKAKTPYALLPGALVGSAPPAIGWAIAGGDIADPRLLALCGLLLLWQLPHFGLLLLDRGEEYARAGLPTLRDVLPQKQLARLVFLWILGAAAAGLLLPLPETAAALRLVLAAGCAVLVAAARKILSGRRDAARGAFHALNAYLVLVLTLAIIASA